MHRMIDYSNTPAVLTEYVLEHRGCPLHYWLGGSTEGPLVVMLHGATMDHRMFNAQVTALSDRYRVLVWDARGHGRSQPSGTEISLELYADDLLHILAAHGMTEFAIIGQSMGGYIAQHLYLRAPGRIRAMVIIGSTPIAKAYPKYEIWALKASLPLFGLWPYEHFTRVIANNTAVTEPVRQYALDAARSIPKDQFVRIWKAVTVAVSAEGMPQLQIDVPLLLMHGDQDKTGTIRRDMQPWAEREAQAEFHLIPDAGHNANQDNPEVVNRLLLDFLQKHL
jgi:3-oxoadipate enol-lactonase